MNVNHIRSRIRPRFELVVLQLLTYGSSDRPNSTCDSATLCEFDGAHCSEPACRVCCRDDIIGLECVSKRHRMSETIPAQSSDFRSRRSTSTASHPEFAKYPDRLSSDDEDFRGFEYDYANNSSTESDDSDHAPREAEIETSPPPYPELVDVPPLPDLLEDDDDSVESERRARIGSASTDCEHKTEQRDMIGGIRDAVLSFVARKPQRISMDVSRVSSQVMEFSESIDGKHEAGLQDTIRKAMMRRSVERILSSTRLFTGWLRKLPRSKSQSKTDSNTQWKRRYVVLARQCRRGPLWNHPVLLYHKSDADV